MPCPCYVDGCINTCQYQQHNFFNCQKWMDWAAKVNSSDDGEEGEEDE